MTDHETGTQRACLGWCGRGALLSPVQDMVNLKFLKNLQLRLFRDNVAYEPTVQQLRICLRLWCDQCDAQTLHCVK